MAGGGGGGGGGGNADMGWRCMVVAGVDSGEVTYHYKLFPDCFYC